MAASLQNTGEMLLESVPGLLWARDEVGIVLTMPDQARTWLLTGLEAEVWSLLAHDRPSEEVLALLSAQVGCGPEEAPGRLLELVYDWEARGIVRMLRPRT